MDDELDRRMEEELTAFTQANGEPYRLVALPMASAVWASMSLPVTSPIA